MFVRYDGSSFYSHWACDHNENYSKTVNNAERQTSLLARCEVSRCDTLYYIDSNLERAIETMTDEANMTDYSRRRCAVSGLDKVNAFARTPAMRHATDKPPSDNSPHYSYSFRRPRLIPSLVNCARRRCCPGSTGMCSKPHGPSRQLASQRVSTPWIAPAWSCTTASIVIFYNQYKNFTV